MRANEIVIRVEQTPGYATFDNYEEAKDYLEKELEAFSREYSLDNYTEAEEDLRTLRAVKRSLFNKKKELEMAYKKPIEEVLAQMQELIDMVKKPMNALEKYIKNHEREYKEKLIYTYAQGKSGVLGKYAWKVLNSPAFFNPRWKNKSYPDTSWKWEIDTIIRNASKQIETIVTTGGEYTNALLGFYFEKLSTEGLEDFFDTLTKGVEEMTTLTEDEQERNERLEKPYTVDPETGEVEYVVPEPKVSEIGGVSSEQVISKVFRLSGTEKSIVAFLNSAENYGVWVQEEKLNGNMDSNTDVSSSNKKSYTRPKVGRAGASWSEDEDNQLKEEYERGDRISDISKKHERTRGAITARLEKLGLVDKR